MSKRWRVLNLQEIDHIPDVLDPLKAVADVLSLPPTEANLREHLPSCDACLPALKVRLTRDVIEQCPNLRVVATPSTGTDHLDVACLQERGIDLLSLKHDTDFLSNITCTAEMGWALLLAVIRKLPWGFTAAQKGIWARDRYRGHQLAGMTLGILGYGRLGRIMADIGQGFRMHVLACDTQDVEFAEGITRVDFDTLLAESDVLSIHVHLTEENRGLINREAFTKMKKGAFLVNTSRGAIIDEVAFLDALESGSLGGAGVDVINGEWDENLADHALIRYANTHENLVISPHTGGVTFESQRMALRFTAEKLAKALREMSRANLAT